MTLTFECNLEIRKTNNKKGGGFALFPTHPSSSPNDVLSFYHISDLNDIWTLHCA